MIILGHPYVTLLLAKMLIWVPFSQTICTFYFRINLTLELFGATALLVTTDQLP